MYLWTEKAEQRAKALSLEERKAGTQAMYGREPLLPGQISAAWLELGYITIAD
jgi:hypothetical protein